MMSGEIIRQGDPTSHGGTVLEGSLSDICMGKPIAYLGHKVNCPLCKGSFPIIEGVLTSTFYGKSVAVAGMKTACGATLIATQFSDTIQRGQGDSQSVASQQKTEQENYVNQGAQSTNATASAQFNEKFILLDDSTGKPLPNTEYAILRENGKVEFGTTDGEGKTHLLSSTKEAESITIYVEAIT